MFFASWKPPADVFYAGERWIIKVELAGVSPDDVEIAAQDRTLTIRGRRRDRWLQQGFACHSLEISYTRFERSIILPARIETNSIRWEYLDGILRIQLNTRGARS
ncbi:MAG: Hsp20/alpha crystallin family protein [Pseudomonadales bacterium]|nr:Hsp20/alpha crystallin family protein [Pseudomonadales bacterium]